MMVNGVGIARITMHEQFNFVVAVVRAGIHGVNNRKNEMQFNDKTAYIK